MGGDCRQNEHQRSCGGGAAFSVGLLASTTVATMIRAALVIFKVVIILEVLLRSMKR